MVVTEGCLILIHSWALIKYPCLLGINNAQHVAISSIESQCIIITLVLTRAKESSSRAEESASRGSSLSTTAERIFWQRWRVAINFCPSVICFSMNIYTSIRLLKSVWEQVVFGFQMPDGSVICLWLFDRLVQALALLGAHSNHVVPSDIALSLRVSQTGQHSTYWCKSI